MGGCEIGETNEWTETGRIMRGMRREGRLLYTSWVVGKAVNCIPFVCDTPGMDKVRQMIQANNIRVSRVVNC